LSDIFVTMPHLPPFEEMATVLREIWDNRILTNAGPFHQKFEARLAEFFMVENVSLVNNGTMALSLALKAAKLGQGEVVTTPFSFVATTHAIASEGLTPVFAEIGEDNLNIDPAAVEAAITPRTKAILAVHCYGNPCDVEALEAIAKRHGLVLIYDAAHAFGVEYRGSPLMAWGDFSTTSFHATKVFNTFEGGAIVARTAEGKRAIDHLRNFGIVDEVTVESVGGNAKMQEFSAALGLLQLDWVEHCRTQRARVDDLYRRLFAQSAAVKCLPVPSDCKRNYSYFPVLIGDGNDGLRDTVYAALKQSSIHARRYFFPLLSNLPMYADFPSSDPRSLKVANRAAQRVLCLPIYPDLADETVERIANAVLKSVA
jgi:dTDP-4-amino-4,6-dideoxygalactose transaminase